MTDGQTAPDINARVARGLAWVGLASSIIAVLDLLAALVIVAIWIPPEEYGIAALAMSVFPVLDVLSDVGLSSAVVQRTDHTSEKLSTVFWVNLTLSVVVCGVIALVAPAFADFTGHAVVASMLMVYGLKLVLQNSYLIPQALMKHDLRFKELSIIRISANLADFTSKFIFAATGFGAWTYILAKLVYAATVAIGSQICRPWAPRLVLRLRETRSYLSFGARSFTSQALFHFYTNVDYPIVNHFFGPAALGIYKLAYEAVLEPVRFASIIVVETAFPTFARLRSQPDKLTDQFVSFSRLNLVIVLPFVAVMVLLAPEVIDLIWGAKGAGGATAIRVLAIVGVLRAVSFVIPPLLDGIGRPQVTLVYMVVAAIVLPACYVLSAMILGDDLGFLSVAVGWAVGYPVAFAVLLWLALAVLQLSTLSYLRRIGGVVLCTAIATAAAFGVALALGSATAGVRAAAVTATFLVILGPLLSRTQGLGIKAMLAAVRGSKT